MKMFPDRSRECLYYLAVGYYRLENYSDAKKFAEVLLRHEPGNLQAKSLLDRINAQVAKGTLQQALRVVSFRGCDRSCSCWGGCRCHRRDCNRRSAQPPRPLDHTRQNRNAENKIGGH